MCEYDNVCECMDLLTLHFGDKGRQSLRNGQEKWQKSDCGLYVCRSLSICDQGRQGRQSHRERALREHQSRLDE